MADALRAAGFPAIHHDEHFSDQGTPDEVWLAAAGREHWIVLSADKAIRRKPNELEALIVHRARAVFLTSGNMRGDEQGALLVKLGRKIQDTAMRARAPYAFGLTKDGRLMRLGLKRSTARDV